MNKRKAAIGIAVLFALGLSAFAAASASASGYTAYTCVKGAGPRAGAHCLPGAGDYGHVEIKVDETTTGTITNSNTAEGTSATQPIKIKGSLFGVSTEIKCPDIHGEGTFENRTDSGEMYAHTEYTLHFTDCVVESPSGKGCKVAGGTFTTTPLTATTQGKGHTTTTTAKEGTTIASIKIEGCSIGALNNTFPLSGSFSAVWTNATPTTTESEVTAQNTLKFGGTKAGIESAFTIKAHSKMGEETNALVPTTSL